MDWFKTYQDGILRGSLARANHTTQLIWVKLLAMENETRLRDGWLHYKHGEPMPRPYLAMVCNVSEEDFEAAILSFLDDLDRDGHPRIEIAEDGDIFIKNWEKYQAKPERLVAKEIAIAKAKETKRRQGIITDATLRAVNTLNTRLKSLRYEIVNGEVVDKHNGEVISIEELKKRQGGKK